MMKIKQISKLSLLVLFTLAIAANAFAQTTVKGKITDALDASELPGVNILEKGTANGTVTDIFGNFSLTVGENATLVLSYVGYVTQEVAVGTQTDINILLEQDVAQLAEIVVIGYGQVKKTDLTGSVVAVGPKDFNKGAIVSPQALLAGRVPGLQVSSQGGAPGAGSTIRIRGGSSLTASNEPLIVIDGVPVDNDATSGLRNPLSIVNPNDIESMSVLKDASATAIYGSRASNGVIIITTKRGTSDRVRFTYSGNVAVHTLPAKVDVLTADELRALSQEESAAGNADATQALALYGTESTDWQDEIFETAIGTDHNVSATGAFKDVPFRVSLGYTDQKGTLKTSRFRRTSISAGIDPSFLDDHLKVKLNFKGILAKNNFPNEGAIGAAVSFDPTQPTRVAGSPLSGFFFWPDGSDPNIPLTVGPANPLAQIELVDNQADVNRILTNAQIDYKLQFFPDISVNLNVALDKSTSDGLEIISPDASWEWTSFGGRGKRNIYEQEKTNELLEATVKYNKDLGDAGRLDVLAGYSWQHFERENIDSLNNIDETVVWTEPQRVFATENFLISFFGRVNYTYKDRYVLTFTLRRDGSSRFAEENRWGLFPSAAFAWNMEQESFLSSSNSVSQMKVRLGYGVTGQQQVGGDYPALARVSSANNSARYQFGSEFITPVRFEGFDANLKWEETTTYNAGLDFGFLDDRITGSVDYYHRETVDLLNNIPIPLGTNFTNRLTTNIGSLENTGFEIALNGYVIDNNDFSWNAGINVTRNVNKITKLTAVEDPDFIGVLTGGISGGIGNTIQVHRVGEPAFSFFTLEQVYGEDGRPIDNLFVDQNNDGVINDLDRLPNENPVPDVFLGFSSRINYKNFDFSFNARANIGQYVYNNVDSDRSHLSNLFFSQGFTNNLTSDIFNTRFANARFLSDYYLQDASFFRLDNLNFGYNFDTFFSDDISAYLGFTVQNVFVITNYTGLDPEAIGAKDAVTNDEPRGIDNNIFPRPRTYQMSIRVNF